MLAADGGDKGIRVDTPPEDQVPSGIADVSVLTAEPSISR